MGVPQEKRDAANKARNFRKKTRTPEYDRRFLDRKKDLQRGGVLEYRNEVNKRYKSNHIEEIRAKDRARAKQRRKVAK